MKIQIVFYHLFLFTQTYHVYKISNRVQLDFPCLTGKIAIAITLFVFHFLGISYRACQNSAGISIPFAFPVSYTDTCQWVLGVGVYYGACSLEVTAVIVHSQQWRCAEQMTTVPMLSHRGTVLTALWLFKWRIVLLDILICLKSNYPRFVDQ